MRTHYSAQAARRPNVKTTIDLPRSLLKRAKHHAVENETTLKAMVIAGLKKELNLP